MLEAGLPPLPSVADFVARLTRPDVDGMDAPPDLFQGVFPANADPTPRGTKGIHVCALKLVNDFEAVLLKQGFTAVGLDHWFEQLAKFAMDPVLISEVPTTLLVP